MALVAAFFVFDLRQYFSFEYFQSKRAQIDAYFHEHPLQTGLAFFLVYVAVTGLSLPGAAILTLVAGAIFGLLWGTVIVSFASSIGATLAFLASRFLLRDWVQAKFGDKLKPINEGIGERAPSISSRCAWCPPSVLRDQPRDGPHALQDPHFYWVSQLGMLAGTIVYVYAGTQLGQFKLSAGLIAAFVILGIFPIVAKKVLDALKARKVYAKWPRPAKFDSNVVVIGAGLRGTGQRVHRGRGQSEGHADRATQDGRRLPEHRLRAEQGFHSLGKMLLMRRSKEFGIRSASADFDFAEVMERVQKVIGSSRTTRSSATPSSGSGECVTAKITSPWTVEPPTARGTLADEEHRRRHGRACRSSAIPGLKEATPFTSETVWNLRDAAEAPGGAGRRADRLRARAVLRAPRPR